MRQLIMLVGAILVSAVSFAGIPSASSSKHSPLLNSLGTAWKSPQATQSLQRKDDLEMVYGGEDVSMRPTLSTRTITL